MNSGHPSVSDEAEKPEPELETDPQVGDEEPKLETSDGPGESSEESFDGRVEIGVRRQRRLYAPMVKNAKRVDLIEWVFATGQEFPPGAHIATFAPSGSSKTEIDHHLSFGGVLVEASPPGEYEVGAEIGLVELAEE